VLVATAIVGAALGAVAADSAQSLLSPETATVSCAQLNPTGGNDSAHYYYLPSEFPTPEGPAAEPIAAF
jgi:hypothetical protein